MVHQNLKDVWRYAMDRSGAQCVTTSGTMWMLEWHVLNWATALVVSYIIMCIEI